MAIGEFASSFQNNYGHHGRLHTVSARPPHTATYSYVANSPLVEQIQFTANGQTVMTTTRAYDQLNRLTAFASIPAAAAPVSFAYAYNAASQRTALTNADASRWAYEYDALGQVTSGKKYGSDGTPVAGQQFAYAFDDIGNRRSATRDGRTAGYTANQLNQYTARTVPGYVNILGEATNTATVSVLTEAGVFPASRHGAYWRAEVAVNNSVPLWLALTNIAVLQQGTNADLIATNRGHLLVPQTPETFTYDADGNLTSDSLWTNTWDGENRRTVIESRSGVPAAARVRVQWTHLPDGRWIERIVSTNDGTAYQPAFTNRYVWDGNVLLAVLNHTNGLELSFLRGLDLSGTPQGAGGVGGLLAVRVGPALPCGPLTNTTHFAAYDGNGNVAHELRTHGKADRSLIQMTATAFERDDTGWVQQPPLETTVNNFGLLRSDGTAVAEKPDRATLDVSVHAPGGFVTAEPLAGTVVIAGRAHAMNINPRL